MQAENEAAVQQIKKLKLDHAHMQQRYANDSARLQRAVSQHQVADVGPVLTTKQEQPMTVLHTSTYWLIVAPKRVKTMFLAMSAQ